MPGAVQRDFITELEDAKTVSSVEMQEVVNRLPVRGLLTTAEVAEALYLSTQKVYELVESGELAPLNTGSPAKPYYRFPRVSVINYIRKAITK